MNALNAPQPSVTGRLRPLPAIPGTSYRVFIQDRFFLLVAILLLVIFTLAPFEASFSRTELITRFQDGAITTPGDLLKLLGHFAAFYALGCLVASVYEKSLDASGFRRFAVVAILFCGALELVQFFQLSRHARVADFLFNSAGLLLGARGAIRWELVRRCRLALQERANRNPLRLQACVFTAATSLWLFVGLRPLMGSLRMDWDASYPLLIANETDGSRPWLGEIQYIGIYGRAFSQQEALSAYSGVQKKGSSEGGLLAGYDFTKAGSTEVSPEGSLRSSDLVIQIPPASTWQENGGILLKKASLLASRGSASELTKAISSSGAFSVEAWIRPADQTQTGPARIVGISNSIWRRNFTLGQEDATGVFRVRNATSGVNGAEQELQVGSAIQSSLQHLVAVYDHGVSMIFRDGQLLSPVLDLREPNMIFGFGRGSPARIAAGILLALLIALPAHSILVFLRAHRPRHIAAVVAAGVIGALPYAITCLIVGGPWRNGYFLGLGAALLVAYPLAFPYVYRRHAERLTR